MDTQRREGLWPNWQIWGHPSFMPYYEWFRCASGGSDLLPIMRFRSVICYCA